MKKLISLLAGCTTTDHVRCVRGMVDAAFDADRLTGEEYTVLRGHVNMRMTAVAAGSK